MDEKPKKAIENAIYRLLNTPLHTMKTVDIVQIAADDKFDVFLSQEDVMDQEKVIDESYLVSLMSLGKLMMRSYMTSDQTTKELLRRIREQFACIKEEIHKRLDQIEEEFFEKLRKITKTTSSFVDEFSDGLLNDDNVFFKEFENLVRSLDTKNVEKGLKRILMLLNEEKAKASELICPLFSNMLGRSLPSFASRILPEKSASHFFGDIFENGNTWPYFELIYRGSRDGFSSKKFHELCDGKGCTLSLIRNNKGSVFGGYTTLPWESPESQTFKRDPESFLFSWDSKKILRLENPEENCIRMNKDYGPGFGSRNVCDLALFNNCNENFSNYMALNGAYSSNGRSLQSISQNKHFKVAEFEVFLVTFN